MNGPIDIVIPWVDEKDSKWQMEKAYWSQKETGGSDLSNNRYQSWDNLHLWFRAVEKCLPWFHRIFLITCGQIPAFLRTDHPKLVLVDHKSYIPDDYLPTFNSNTIEMNLFRIASLSENYILFNDDVIPLSPIPEEYYFINDVVCDEAVENIITTASFGNVNRIMRHKDVNNMFIINRYFKKREIQKKHPELWFNEAYGERLERTLACSYWYDFPGFYDHHLANALKKSVLAHLWEIEPELLDLGSRNRFRGSSDVTQYLIRYWQICSGEFCPRRAQGKVFFPVGTDAVELVSAIQNAVYPIICYNENCKPEEFEVLKKRVNDALESRFPDKCSFEL